MLLILFQQDFLTGIPHFTVNPQTGIALLADMLQKLLVLPLLAPDSLGHHQELRPLRQQQKLVQHLVDGLLIDRLATFRAVGMPHPGKQQTEIIVNFRHCPHRRTGIAAGGLLVNGNRRGKPLYIVHIRLVHLPQELPGIGGQGLHIPPLPLGINRIKSQ